MDGKKKKSKKKKKKQKRGGIFVNLSQTGVPARPLCVVIQADGQARGGGRKKLGKIPLSVADPQGGGKKEKKIRGITMPPQWGERV